MSEIKTRERKYNNESIVNIIYKMLPCDSYMTINEIIKKLKAEGIGLTWHTAKRILLGLVGMNIIERTEIFSQSNRTFMWKRLTEEELIN